jgi:hypothetical protein
VLSDKVPQPDEVQQQPWPPPKLEVLCSIDIHGWQLTNRGFEVSPTLSVFGCPNAQLTGAPKLLAEMFKHVHADLMDSRQLDTGQLVISTFSVPRLKNIEIEALSTVISDDSGAGQRPPWPPPELEIVDCHTKEDA